jgi:hypothetical protein
LKASSFLTLCDGVMKFTNLERQPLLGLFIIHLPKLPLDKAFNPILDDIDFAKLFDRLIIGPSPYPMAMFDAYVEALSNADVAEAAKKIFISGIPIRS